MDYYNATGGRWEPLLERVVAQGDREIVTRNGRGMFAEGTGDDHDEENDGGGVTSSVVRLSCFEEDVKVYQAMRKGF